MPMSSFFQQGTTFQSFSMIIPIFINFIKMIIFLFHVFTNFILILYLIVQFKFALFFNFIQPHRILNSIFSVTLAFLLILPSFFIHFTIHHVCIFLITSQLSHFLLLINLSSILMPCILLFSLPRTSFFLIKIILLNFLRYFETY